MSEFQNVFSDIMKTTIAIKRTVKTGYTSSLNTIQTLSNCGFWQATAKEQVISDRTHNPSTHVLVLDPSRLSVTILAEDIITIGGVDYSICRPDDILGLGEVMRINLEAKG